MKITILGTGSPAPSLKRQSSGYMVEIGDDVIIFDHGPGAHHRLMEAGKRSTDVTHFFLTHLHYDHWMDYPRLVLQRWDIGAGKFPALKVFGPQPLKRLTNLLFQKDGVFGLDIYTRTHHQGSIDIYKARGGIGTRKWEPPEVTEVKPGDKIENGQWTITVAESSHVQPHIDCLAYRLDSDEGSFCYSGDSGGVCPAIVELAQGADVLVHMNHYRSGTEPSDVYRAVCGNHIDTATVAKKAGVKTLVLTHFLEQIDQPGVREEILREMMQIFDGNIIWGEDLMEVQVKGPKMMEMD
jgi:ribonuclease BN (tRNA processing enzyme)